MRRRAVRFRSLRRAVAVAALLSTVLFAPPNACALDVEREEWGFDGQAVAKRFNILSVLVRNNTPNNYDGQLTLRRRSGGGQVVDAPVVESVFVSPFSSRWVQFTPFCSQEYDVWQDLSWGRGLRDRKEIAQAKFGPPARVFLVPAEDFASRAVGAKRFPDNLFPASVTATDGLGSVILGHVPRWEQARRRAFLDWLVRGGTVHLLRDATGKPLQFPADLADLNAPLDEFRVGSGRVFRHALDRAALKPVHFDLAEARWRPLQEAASVEAPAVAEIPAQAAEGSEFLPGLPLTNSGAPDAAIAAPSDDDENRWHAGDAWLSDVAQGVFGQLKNMTKADHHWGIIYLMALAYIGLIFPGFYILGRKRLDYRVVYGAFLGVVAIFSLGFAWVGRRGYGESTTVHGTAIARELGGGAWDVNLWANAFVRDGADYRIAHTGTGLMYSTSQDVEAVNGVIRNGPEAAFLVDIPPYSSRSFSARAKLDSVPVKFEAAPAAGASRGGPGLTLSLQGKLPQQPTRAVALHRNLMHELAVLPDRLECRGSVGQPIFQWFSALEEDPYGMGRLGIWGEQNETLDARYARLFQPLVARSLDFSSRKEMKKYSLPPDCVRVFVYAGMPEEFHVQNEKLGRQDGRVLFVFDLFPSDLQAGP